MGCRKQLQQRQKTKNSHIMIKKRALLIGLATLAIACACNNKNTNEGNQQGMGADSLDTISCGEENRVLDTIDWEADDCPMPMYTVCSYDENYNVTSSHLRHLFDNEEQKEYFTRRAKNYTTLLNADKQIKITYKGVHEGPEMGCWIGGNYGDRMSGLDYTCKGKWEDGFAFTDNFMKTHEAVPINRNDGKAPKSVIDSLKAKYGMKIHSTQKCAASKDGQFAIYSVQMEPKNKKCLGMRVVKIQDRLVIKEDWADPYDEWSGWNVDDGGEYLGIWVTAVTKGDSGYDIFYSKGAPESSVCGVLLVRGDKIVDHQFCNFYNYIDYQPQEERTEE